MDELRNATIVFLIKKSHGKITEICLAMKKRGFGVGKWNGVGGKVEAKETIEAAAKRETREEINVETSDLTKCAELAFSFPHNPAWGQLVHVYLCEKWQGEPQESEEMNPKWFSVNKIPYQEMWADDPFWLPEILQGHLVKGAFEFGENDVIQSKEIGVVDAL